MAWPVATAFSWAAPMILIASSGVIICSSKKAADWRCVSGLLVCDARRLKLLTDFRPLREGYRCHRSGLGTRQSLAVSRL